MQDVFKHFKHQEKINKAKSRFTWKPLFIRLEDLHQTANYSRLLFHLFSVLMAFFFLLELIQSAGVNYYISVVLSVLILVVIEKTKSRLLELGFESFYYGDSKYLIYALGGLLFLSGSVYSSLQGAKKYHDKNTTKIEDNERVYNTAKDSITLSFLTAIKETKQERETYISSVSWRGKIDIHNKATKQILSNFDSKIVSLEAQKLESLDETKKAYSLGFLRANQENKLNSTLIIIISGINESIILLICWFMVFYDYSIYKESHIIEEVRPTFNQNIDEIKTYFNTYLSTANTYQVLNEKRSEEDKQIGFKPPNSPQVLTAKNNEPQEQNNKALILDLKSGVIDTRYLTHKHSVNVITLNKIKKSLGITSKKAKKPKK